MGERGMWAWCSCPSSRFFNFVQQQSTRHCAESACGAYQAFFDSNIQADFVHVDDLEFTPDLLEDLKLQVQTKAMGGRFFLQQYQLAQVGRPTRQAKTVTINLDPGAGAASRAQDVWNSAGKVKLNRGVIEVSVEDRNAAIIRLDP